MKKIRINKIWIILTAIALFMLAVYFILTLISVNLGKSIPESYVVEKWSPDSSQYSYTSCYLSESCFVDTDRINGIRNAVDTALQQASVTNESENENSRLWLDGYSMEKTMYVSAVEDNASVEVAATFCGGDFFYFHDMKYKSGYCFPKDDINGDRVVIDENTAWIIFGASDVEGMKLKVNDRTFIVAGVTEIPDDDISKLTYGDRNRIYLPYSAAEEFFDAENIYITCYETLLPSPVSKFGYNIMLEQFPESSSDSVVVENSSRFSDKALIEVMKQYGSRSVVTRYVAYPYWENSARVIEDKLALIMFFRLPLLIIPILYMVTAVIVFFVKYRIRSADCMRFIENIADRHRRKVYYANEKNKKEGVNNDEN